MRIGFAGAHRTGKTTLTKAVAEHYSVPILTNHASEVVTAHDFNMATDNRLDTGVKMQFEQLAVMTREIERQGFVTDRTPLDAAAYFMADATAGAGCDRSRETAVQYVEKAMVLTAKHFDLVILVPPAITFVPVDGKPPMNVAYQEHIHLLIQGMLFDDEIDIPKCQIKRTNFTHLGRASAVFTQINRQFGFSTAFAA